MNISNLVRQEPWRLFNNLFDYQAEHAERAEHKESNIATSNWTPAVDIKEDDKGFTLVADIPGVDPKDIDIQMENGVLTIKGERTPSHDTKSKDYKRVERASGSFYRRFSLPDTADAESISANSKHGVLEVSIPKLKKVQARRISINS